MVSFSHVSRQTPIYAFLSSVRATCPAHIIHLDCITRTLLGEEYRSVSSSLCSFFFPFPYYLVPLRPKYFPQHPTVKHHQPTSVPQCQRPRFTPIQNNRQNYNYLCLQLAATLYSQILQFIIKSNFCCVFSIPLFSLMQAFCLLLVQST